MADDPRAALLASAARLGLDPLDYATVISFETGGTFNPATRGGAGNRHIGLIQFGEAEQRQFGAHQGQTFGDQLLSAEKYLTTRGFKPGMGLLDLYSTINAGSPGRYNASDARNGGTPGTVADKVNDQMGGHRQKAAAWLGGTYQPPMQMPGSAGGPVGSVSLGLTGAEAAAASSPVMAMPNAPDPSAPASQPDPSAFTTADLMKLLAGPIQAATQTPSPAATQAPPIEPPEPAPPFDAARFFALLNKRSR